MMLSKSLVFIFAAFTAVSGVAAAPQAQGNGNNGGPAAVSSAATPATTVSGSGNNGSGNNGGYAAPPSPTTVTSCDGGSIVCCDVFTTGTDAGSAVSGLLGSLPPLTTYVGLTCASVTNNQCNTHPLCCKTFEQGIGLQCEPITL